MLKIKDNVDLKELKKFGFVETKDEYIYRNDETWESVKVQIKNRYIYYELEEFGFYGAIIEDFLYKLFDLIQAGLVEKVVENE